MSTETPGEAAPAPDPDPDSDPPEYVPFSSEPQGPPVDPPDAPPVRRLRLRLRTPDPSFAQPPPEPPEPEKPEEPKDAEKSDEEDERWKCSICLEELREPVVTQCGHVFCFPCITEWLRRGQTACPLCHGLIDGNKLIPIHGQGTEANIEAERQRQTQNRNRSRWCLSIAGIPIWGTEGTVFDGWGNRGNDDIPTENPDRTPFSKVMEIIVWCFMFLCFFL